MKSGKIVITAALLLYAAVIGCVMSSTDSSAGSAGADSVPVTGLVKINGLRPFCGITLRLQRVDWIADYEKTIDAIAAEGADTVSLVVDARQEDAGSTRMYVDMRMTMTPEQMAQIIGHAKSKHLRVVLMPVVLLDNPRKDSEWRGTLKPEDPKSDNPWHEWFDSYRDMIEHFARIAQNNGVDLLVVGSELVSSEDQADEWIQTIKDVRNIYKGQLTYSSNWDRYWKVSFWKYLDFVSMNSYWTLGNDRDATVEEMQQKWKEIQDKIFEFQAKVHKPVILLEVGWCSLANAAKDPWDYTQTQLDADNDLQRKLYEAFFRSWWGKPQLAGFMIWEMHPGDDPDGRGYTPQGKPAEEVMRQWLSKPRWDVMNEE